MFIHILGSCSGTPPILGRDYTSWVLETSNGHCFWFDAGGGCAATAWHRGLSPLAIRALFISHPHSDHTSGLVGLFSTLREAKWQKQDRTEFHLRCYTSLPCQIESADLAFKPNGRRDEWDYVLEIHKITSGLLLQDADVQVEAISNNHMPPDPFSGEPLSYSFRISTGNQRLVYTGDVKSLDELSTWLEAPIQLLMLETGHHRAVNLCRQIRERQWPVEQLLFLHHGVEILRDPIGEKAEAEKAWGKAVLFASDGMTLFVNSDNRPA